MDSNPIFSQETLKVLEWNRFVELATEQALSENGKSRVELAKNPATWATDVKSAQARQTELTELMFALDRQALWSPLKGLTQSGPTLEKLGKQSVLELSELVCLRGWLDAIDHWIHIPPDEVKSERIKKAILSLMHPDEPLRALHRVLTSEGEISESATPRFKQLHSEMRSVRKEIDLTLDRVLKTLAQKGVLQENFTDIRDGHYVVPVKISQQGEVNGVIYEASVSRQTAFVEPAEVAPLNSRLRKLQNDLIQETYEILKATSKLLEPYREELESAIEVLTFWDATQARARLGRHYSGKPIQVVEERVFILRQTAHPLLWWSLPTAKITRSTLIFEPPKQTLLITGPNTGGKTVLLKCLGMAAVCARAGFSFPSSESPTVPFFDQVFADLGDPQSIEAHLSSFSGHILRFKEILESTRSRTLVLFDELSSATDPEEGSSLGRAILETIMDQGAVIVATTHDPILKAISTQEPRIQSASMQFDTQTQTPTYQLILGVPGLSRALETAERLGLPEGVLIKARQYLSTAHKEFERLLSSLQNDAQLVESARKDAVRLRVEAEALKREWTERTQNTLSELFSTARQRLRRMVEQAQDDVKIALRKLEEVKDRPLGKKELEATQQALSQNLAQSANKMDQLLEEEAPHVAALLREQEKEKQESQRDLKVGMTVRIPKWKALGQILEISGGKAKVAMGNIQMAMSLSDLYPTDEEASGGGPVKKSRKNITQDIPPSPGAELDLRGIRYEEAMQRFEQYIDQAFRCQILREVNIITGLGTGAIRDGVRGILKSLPYVKEFRDGGVGRGGAGATIVEFD